MFFTTHGERSNGLVAWRPPTESLSNAVHHYVLEIYRLEIDENSSNFELVEKFTYSENYAVLPSEYVSDGDLFYAVNGIDLSGNIILYTDLRPVCSGCSWEVNRSWGCYGRDFAYTIKEHVNQQNKVYYSLNPYVTQATKSEVAEYFSNYPGSEQPNKGKWEYPDIQNGFTGPYRSKNGTLLSGTIWGRKLPLGPSSEGDWGATTSTEVFSLASLTSSTTLGQAIARFNYNRRTTSSTNKPNINLHCNVQYPGYSGTFGGPFGNADVKPLEVNNDILVQLVCFADVWVYDGLDENNEPVYSLITVQIPCDQVNSGSVNTLTGSVEDVVRIVSGENNSSGSNLNTPLYNDIELVRIKKLSGTTTAQNKTYYADEIFDESGEFIFNSSTVLSPGIYEVMTLFDSAQIGITTFLVPKENPVIVPPSFVATIFPVPNNGEYNIKISSESEKEFQYEVYDLNGNYYFNENVTILEYASEIEIPITLDVNQPPVYGQLIHKITDGNGQVQIIQTTFNGN